MTAPETPVADAHTRSRWSDAVCLSVGTLTRLPVPPPRSVDRRAAGRAMTLAPLTGLGLGAVAAGALVLARACHLGVLPAAALALAVLAWGSRGLHLDGLSDTADGLAASYRPQRALEIMRSGNSGPAGTATLVCVLLVQFAALTQAAAGPGGGAVLLLAGPVGRGALTLACRRGVPAARPGGLGAMVAGTVPSSLAAGVWAVLIGACGLGAATAGLDWWRGGLAAVAAATTGVLLTRRVVARLGGITGDVLGACVEAATTTCLLVLAT